MTSLLVPRPGPAFARHGGIAGTSGALGAGARQALSGFHLIDRHTDASVVADVDGGTLGELVAAARDDRLGAFEGAFAIAWRDEAGIHLARDAIGHRTLFYAIHRGELVFASRLRPLLDAFELRRDLDHRAVAWFLSCAYVPNERTMIEGVRELLPGEQVTLRDGRLARRAFWTMPAEPARPEREPDLRARLRGELERVIGAALPDGPVCASLSGGIDSSLVVAIARKLSRHPVRTFSITFGADYKNELAWSSQVAAHVRSEHHVVELRPETVLAHLDHTIACLDKPNGDPLTVPNALLFREMAAHGPVALNGEGGDPSFGGPKNTPMLLAELYGDVDGGDPALARERSYLRAHLKCFDDLATLLAPDVHRAACTPPLEGELSPWFSDPRWPSFVGMLMAINVRFKGGHHILPKVDALARPFGILPRSPLFARPIVELAFAIPSSLKLAGSVEKYLLKEAVRDLLPAAVVDRPKSGMLVPVEGWFQGPLLPQAKERLLDGCLSGTLLDRAMIERLLAGKHLGLRPRRGVKIWLLVTLESHLRALRAQVTGAPPARPV